ncbi:hypothetical protein [Roseovarius sp.]|uniref:hypothetical protein n=1 Tax=Roseovarius sp. TaxID=1486281 RepID=UPI003A974870
MASILFPDPDRLAEHSPEFSVLSHIPIVLHPTGAVFTEATDYLRDRALMIWRNGRRKSPSAGSVRQFAYNLSNFLDWCDEMDLDWRGIDRGHDAEPRSLVGYARMMADGRWSDDGPISRATIEARLSVALDYLSYAAAAPRRWRGSFDDAPILGYGQVASADRRCAIPSKADVATWLDRLRVETYPAQHLMTQAIFETGLRREEAVAIRSSQIPPPEAFYPGPYQHIEISYGTKGGRDPADSDRKGKPRTIRVRTDFLERLYLHARNPKERPAALAVFRERHPGEKAPDHLFLNPETGSPYSIAQPNKLFKRAAPAPMSPWTPHMGRHFWACWTLLELLQEEAHLAGLRRGDLLPSTLKEFGHSSLLRLKQYLGHVSEETTDIYLAWASEHLRINLMEDSR